MKIINLVVLSLVFPALVCANEAKIEFLGSSKTHAKTTRKVSRDSELLKKIHKNNQKLTQLLKQKTGEPIIWEKKNRILTGAVLKGTILNSINSTNLESPILVVPDREQGLAINSKFICKGVTKHRRVQTVCDKLVDEDTEVMVNVELLNIDGSSGIIGEYDDGKDDLVVGAIASSAAQGLLSAAQTKVDTTLGSITENTLKNELLGAGIESGKTVTNLLLEDMKTKEPQVLVAAGKRVLIYFKEAIDVK